MRLGDRELTALNQKQLRDVWGADVAMIFQNPATSLNPVRRVGPQITSPLRRHLGMGKRQAREMAASLLDSVGVPEATRRLDAYPHELSGGMCQRVMIAIALVCRPKLLLADEPTTALDVTVQRQVLELLDIERTELSMAMMLVTHDLGVVHADSHDVAVMYAGKVVEHAPTPTLFADGDALYRGAVRVDTAAERRGAIRRCASFPAVRPTCRNRSSVAALRRVARTRPDQCRAAAPPLAPLASDPEHLVVLAPPRW